MAHTLLKKGIRAEEEMWVGKCKGCGAIFECTRSDIDKLIERDQRFGTWAWVKRCSYCGEHDNYGMICYHLQSSDYGKKRLEETR